MNVDAARYCNGGRLPCADISGEIRQIRASGSSDFLWIDMEDPSPAAFARVSDALDLHPLAIAGSVSGVHRPRIERYGDSHVLVLHPLRYLELTTPSSQRVRRVSERILARRTQLCTPMVALAV